MSDIKPLFIILVDISGYTNFIRMHKMNLLHAEKIIGELMESMLDEVESPVVAHEILGDAISLYAIDDGSPEIAFNIYRQLEKYFLAFRKQEAYLLRECGICTCDACNTISSLKVKAILHSGKAAFTKVHEIQKISGQDIITAHRLLKNSIESNEYFFVTNSFLERCQSFDRTDFEEHNEHYEDIGHVYGLVKTLDSVDASPEPASAWKKFKFFLAVEKYMFARLFGKAKYEFRNLPTKVKSSSAT
jgi:Protein of unknown function (DUF2652)